MVLVDKVFRGNDRTRGAVLTRPLVSDSTIQLVWKAYRSRAAHELGQVVSDHGRLQNLFLSPATAELGVRVVDGVLVVFRC